MPYNLIEKSTFIHHNIAMPRIIKDMVGVVVALVGLIAVGWGIYETVLGNWYWLVLSILAASLTVAGFMLISGHKAREVIKIVFETIGF